MKRLFLFTLLFMVPGAHGATPSEWRDRVAQEMPLLGHRNWILIVDSAYPLQTSPGIETIESDASQIEVVQSVLDTIDRSIHVRPEIFMDAELPFVSNEDAPGASDYREEIRARLSDNKVQTVPHEKLIAMVDEAGKTYHVLVIKTKMTIPYSSVFIRLNCKYWSDEAEARMRAKMRANAPK